MTLEDMFKLLTSSLGISFSDYYEMTPRELLLMYEGYLDKTKDGLELYAKATKVAIFNALKGKNHKVFKKSTDENKQVDVDYKRKELNELKKIFT